MMDFTPRIISALKKDTRDRSLEDFNALFEYFVQASFFVTRWNCIFIVNGNYHYLLCIFKV